MLTERAIDDIADKHGDYDQRTVRYSFNADSDCRSSIYSFARALEALVRAECVPPGHVVVPVGPTEAMCIAGGDVLCPYTTEHSVSMYEQAADCWKVMLNAAPDTTPKDPTL